MPLPNFLILGETKCGTTSMYDNIIQHPQILPTKGNGNDLSVDATVPLGVKELRFFDRNYNKGWDWYRDCFPECPEGSITGEATPMYLHRALALQRIASVMKDVKLILMFRDPAKRLVSHYHHIGSINPAWYDKYPTIESFWNTAAEEDYHLIDKGIYWKTVMQVATTFKEDKQMLVIISEDLFEEPDKIFSDVFEFLGVDSDVKIKAQHSRKNKYKTKVPTEIKDFYEPHNRKLERVLERKLWRE